MNSEPEIVIRKGRGKVTKPEMTLEERIQDAAEKFFSERSQDVERTVIGELEEQYDSLLRNTIGFERDTWNGGLRLKGYGGTHGRLQEMVADAVKGVLDRIDFGAVELTQAEVNAIKKVYQKELKEAVSHAARELAQEHALVVAAKVLGLADA